MQPNLFFDLDGTLTDSRLGIIRCIEHALDTMGVVCNEDLSFCLGPPLHHSFARLLKTQDEVEIARAVALYRERFSEVGMFENDVYPGIESLLETLKDGGYRLFVATSKPHVYARPILQHFSLDHWFDGIYGSELSGVRSDKTELIAHLIESEKLADAPALMFGDREHDVRGALNNQLTAVGVLWGYGSEAELTAAGAHHLVSQPSEIFNLL
jgi:phosphoglycolate phosphatase